VKEAELFSKILTIMHQKILENLALKNVVISESNSEWFHKVLFNITKNFSGTFERVKFFGINNNFGT